MPQYLEVKAAIIDVIDDFTDDDVVANYKPNGSKLFDAKTSLDSLYINAPIRVMMMHRINKVMKALTGGSWIPVGGIDIVGLETIGDVIILACTHGKVFMPVGEPK